MTTVGIDGLRTPICTSEQPLGGERVKDPDKEIQIVNTKCQ